MQKIGYISQIAPSGGMPGAQNTYISVMNTKIGPKVSRSLPKMTLKVTFFHRFSSLGYFFQVLYARNWSKITNYTLLGMPGG